MAKKRRKYPKISDRFKGLRAEKDTDEKVCTQDTLADLINIQKPQISDLETGKRLPSINELMVYSRHFKVPMEYLLGMSDSRHYSNIEANSELGLSDKAIEHLKFCSSLTKIGSTETVAMEQDVINLLLGTPKGINLLQNIYFLLFSNADYFEVFDKNGNAQNLKEINIKNIDGNGYNLFIDEIESIMMINIQKELIEIKSYIENEKIKTKSNKKNTGYFIIRSASEEMIKRIQEQKIKEK